MRTNVEYDYNGHVIAYDNDHGVRITDHDYLAAKQAKAISKEFGQSNSHDSNGGGGIVELNQEIIDMSKDPETGKLNTKEFLKNSGLVWGIFALSFILTIALIVGVILLIAWLTSGSYHPLG